MKRSCPPIWPSMPRFCAWATGAEGNVNVLAIEVPYSSLEVQEDSITNLDSVSLSIVADIKDSSGTVVERFSTDIPRRGILKNNEKIKNGVVTFQRHFTALEGQYVLEAAILDHISGKAGAQRIAFEIPGASGAPSLSNMVLVRERTRCKPATTPWSRFSMTIIE